MTLRHLQSFKGLPKSSAEQESLQGAGRRTRKGNRVILRPRGGLSLFSCHAKESTAVWHCKGSEYFGEQPLIFHHPLGAVGS